MSDPYSWTLHSSVFIIRQLRFLSNFTLRSSLLFWNASFPFAILLLISLLGLASVVIIFPRQQNLFVLLHAYYIFSSSAYFDNSFHSSAYLQYLSVFDKYFHSMFL